MERNKKIGILWLVVPILTLFLCLSLWAITIFALHNVSSAAGTSSAAGSTIAQLINVALSLVGILAVIGIVVGIPVGIIYLLRKPEENDVNRLQKLPAYTGLTVEQIQYITGWSWGAFFGNIIWPLGNKLWLFSLLRILPLISLYAWIKLSLSGRQMAWEQGGWQSFAQFKKRQQIIAGVVWGFVILGIVLAVMTEVGSR